MRLGVIVTQTDPETVFNTLRLALYSLQQGDQVRIFLSGKGVDIDKVANPKFDVKGQARKILDAGGEFLACGACLKLRNSEGSEICPLSTLKDQYEIVRDGKAFPAACGVLAKDLADCLTFYRFPQAHWRRLRTSNVIERAFREVRRRTDVVGRFPGETAALVLIWATLEEDRLVWRGVTMDEDLRRRIAEATQVARAATLDLSVLDQYGEAA